MKILRALLVGAILLAPAAKAAEDSEKFREIYEREWAFRFSEFPLLYDYAGKGEYRDRLGHVSEPHQLRRAEYWRGIREELNAISCERLTHSECVDFRIYRKQIEDLIVGVETRAYLLTFNSDSGFYTDWLLLPDETDFPRADEYRDYLARLSMIPEIMDENIELMREGLKIGFTQPAVVLEGRDAPVKRQIVERAEESAFFSPFVDLPADFEGRDSLIAEAREVIGKGVIPAYRRLDEFFTEEYFPGARKTLGASELPGGEAFYRGQIQLYATVDLSPREINQVGLDEVERITAEMHEILNQVEFDGSLVEFIEWLRGNPDFYPDSPRELLAEASYWAKKVDGRLPQLFGRLPRQPYGVAPVPEDLAPFYTAGRYVDAPLDSLRGGYYWVNTHQLESRPLYNLPALTLHEGAPGHHLQNALAKENEDQPPFRRFVYISAYGEGWGLYSEKLGVEMDIYETPYEHFGRLTYEMWRACRLVIDTGIHAFGWTREQAQQYLAQRTALSIHEITTEVDRYISWPAQALSYKLGEYTIWELRREAEAALGDEFDIRDFHDFILALGSVPLDILRQEVQGWVKSQTEGNS